jgi:hypothetical protein
MLDGILENISNRMPEDMPDRIREGILNRMQNIILDNLP